MRVRISEIDARIKAALRAICTSLCTELHCKGRFWLETEDMFLAMADDYRVILVKLADKASGFGSDVEITQNFSCKNQGSATQHAHLTIYVTQPAFKQPVYFLLGFLGERFP